MFSKSIFLPIILYFFKYKTAQKIGQAKAL